MKKIVFIIFLASLLFAERFHCYRADSHKLFEPVSSFGERQKVIQNLIRSRKKQESSLLKCLDSLKNTGGIERFTALWIVNGAVFDGDYKSFRFLKTRFPQYTFRPDAFDTAIISSRRDYHFSMRGYGKSLDDTLVWNVAILDIAEVRRKFGVYGDGILVGIFDTGISRWVPDLVGNIYDNPGEGEVFDSIDTDDNDYIDDIWGYNFRDSTSHPYDDDGHGTHVSGTVAGKLGTGIAPDAKLLGLKVLNSSGSGNESDVWLAVQYALMMNVRVGNFSIGWRYSREPDRPMWRSVMQNATDLGLVVVAGSGNEGSSDPPNNLRTPGDVPEIITVGAIDSTLALASFSSTGPVQWDDYPYPPGLIKPDIVAPGVAVHSCVIPGGYEDWDGTSMATPHITGICALLLQENPELTPAQIKAILESTAVDLGDVGKDNSFGSGFVDIESALLQTADFCTLKYNASVSGTLFAMPNNLKFYGDGDTIFIPNTVEYLVFVSEGYEPETLFSFDCDTEIYFSPSLYSERNCRIGIMDFESGEPISAYIATASDTFYIDGFDEITISDCDVPFVATAPGFTEHTDTIYSDENCKFIFLHRCITFEDSAVFFGDGDWQWGIPTTGPMFSRSGQKLWATALADTYSSSSNSWLYSDWFDVGTSGAVYIWHWFDCEASDWGFWDGGNVVADFGDSSKILFPFGDYDCWLDDYNPTMSWQPAFSGTLTGNYWHQTVFPIQASEPCSVRIGFHFSSDDNTTRPGWYIDDVCLASDTVEPPFVNFISADDGTVRVAAYGVNRDIDDGEIIYCDSSSIIPMERIACDTFFALLVGSPYDTIRFRLRFVDSDGSTRIYPEDSCIVAIIPDSKIYEQSENAKNVSLSISRNLDGFNLDVSGNRIYIYDVLGRCVFGRVFDGEANLFWQPHSSGVYFIRVSGIGDENIAKKIMWVK
ncbi:hypothetical protein DRQ29_04950 [bacterium]|nr:MAG: hypothetical protein DRQ29_04950 [bacterium]